jgi:hypothetical protein
VGKARDGAVRVGKIATQIGLARFAHHSMPISGRPEIGAPCPRGDAIPGDLAHPTLSKFRRKT